MVRHCLRARWVHRLVDQRPSVSLEEHRDLLVAGVCEDGPAQRCGIKNGDRLMSIGAWASDV